MGWPSCRKEFANDAVVRTACDLASQLSNSVTGITRHSYCTFHSSWLCLAYGSGFQEVLLNKTIRYGL